MPDYTPLATTPQAILPRFPDAPEFASREYVNNAVSDAVTNTLASTLFYGNYGGSQPTFSPSSPNALAFDTSAAAIWWWNLQAKAWTKSLT